VGWSTLLITSTCPSHAGLAIARFRKRCSHMERCSHARRDRHEIATSRASPRLVGERRRRTYIRHMSTSTREGPARSASRSCTMCSLRVPPGDTRGPSWARAVRRASRTVSRSCPLLTIVAGAGVGATARNPRRHAIEPAGGEGRRWQQDTVRGNDGRARTTLNTADEASASREVDKEADWRGIPPSSWRLAETATTRPVGRARGLKLRAARSSGVGDSPHDHQGNPPHPSVRRGDQARSTPHEPGDQEVDG